VRTPGRLAWLAALGVSAQAWAGPPPSGADPSIAQAPLLGGSLSDDAPSSSAVCQPRHVTLTLTSADGATHADPQLQASAGGCALAEEHPAQSGAPFPRVVVARCAPGCGELPATLVWLVPDADDLDGLSVVALAGGASFELGPDGLLRGVSQDPASASRIQVMSYDPNETVLAAVHEPLAEPAAPVDPTAFQPVPVTPFHGATTAVAALDSSGALIASGHAALSAPGANDTAALFSDSGLLLIVRSPGGHVVRLASAALSASCQLGTAALEHGQDFPRAVVASCADGQVLWIFQQPGLVAAPQPFVVTNRSDDSYAPRYDPDGELEFVETAHEGGAYPRIATTVWRYSDDDGTFARSTTTYTEEPAPTPTATVPSGSHHR